MFNYIDLFHPTDSVIAFWGGIGFLIALRPDNGVDRVWGLERPLRLAGSGVLMMLCCCVLMLERVHDCNLFSVISICIRIDSEEYKPGA